MRAELPSAAAKPVSGAGADARRVAVGGGEAGERGVESDLDAFRRLGGGGGKGRDEGDAEGLE
jgi:hypothetical protein